MALVLELDDRGSIRSGKFLSQTSISENAHVARGRELFRIADIEFTRNRIIREAIECTVDVVEGNRLVCNLNSVDGSAIVATVGSSDDVRIPRLIESN
jgi:hypothetical protein